MTTTERIFHLLEQKGIEQQQFAQDIGVRKQAISEWKTGKTQSYKKYIDKIASYFNVSTDYLLGNTDNPSLPEDKEIKDEDIKFALFDGAKEITPAMFDEVKAFAKFVQAREAEKAKKKD